MRIKIFTTFFLLTLLFGISVLAKALSVNQNVNTTYRVLEPDKPLISQLNTKNTTYEIRYDFLGGKPAIYDITIPSGKSIQWSKRRYFYKAISLDAGKAITILDRDNCTFLNAGCTDPVGTSTMLAYHSKTTIYIASEKAGNYNNAYRIDDIVEVPAGSSLKFMGGSIKNCYLSGNFLIDAGNTTIFDNTLVDESANNNDLFDAAGDRIADKKSGPSADRPKASEVLRIGFMYFDTTLNKPIWWNGKVWVDAMGKPM